MGNNAHDASGARQADQDWAVPSPAPDLDTDPAELDQAWPGKVKPKVQTNPTTWPSRSANRNFTDRGS